MKKGMRIVALILALAMVLSASAAFADAYTVPKDLKKVEGLPENPEVPTMTTKNDGHTEKVTVIGDVKALYANWKEVLVPLELVDGVATFSIDGHNVQLGMKSVYWWSHWIESITTDWVDEDWYWYDVTKNADGTFTVKEYYEDGYYETLSKNGYQEKLDLPAWSKEKYAGSSNGYHRYKTPYTEVVKPGYHYDVPVSADITRYSVPMWVTNQTTGEVIQVRDPKNGKAIRFKENGDYYIVETGKHPNETGKYIEADKPDEKTEEAINKEIDVAIANNGVDADNYNNGYRWVYYDEDGAVYGRYKVDQVNFKAVEIKGFGDAFEAELEGNIVARYNRKGEVCQKEIFLEGVDFFASEKAPTKVSVVWTKGKNMYNKTVWYISSIGQIYDDIMVMATFSQNGKLQPGGVYEKAVAK
jgi:hypothetical protein